MFLEKYQLLVTLIFMENLNNSIVSREVVINRPLLIIGQNILALKCFN